MCKLDLQEKTSKWVPHVPCPGAVERVPLTSFSSAFLVLMDGIPQLQADLRKEITG